VLAFSFLLLIGATLVADGAGFPIPRGYIYAAIGFSICVEAINRLAARPRPIGGSRRTRARPAILSERKRIMGGLRRKPVPPATDEEIIRALTRSSVRAAVQAGGRGVYRLGGRHSGAAAGDHRRERPPLQRRRGRARCNSGRTVCGDGGTRAAR
jgi:hypothetical protein